MCRLQPFCKRQSLTAFIQRLLTHTHVALILYSEPDIIEVFSRGQNPQHWHIAKKGVSLGSQNGGVWKEGEIYLEVFRKETSLTDVDNILAKVVKKSGLLDEIDISDPRNL